MPKLRFKNFVLPFTSTIGLELYPPISLVLVSVSVFGLWLNTTKMELRGILTVSKLFQTIAVEETIKNQNNMFMEQEAIENFLQLKKR